MTFTYTPITPQGSHFPANDRPLMTANFQYLQKWADRDHKFTLLSGVNTQDGTHLQVTMAANLAMSPLFNGGVSVLYPKEVGNVLQSQLYFNNAAGDVQLTSVQAAVGALQAVPSITSGGGTVKAASFLPGGFIIQWGSTTGPNIVFPVTFAAGILPTVTFSVTGTNPPGIAPTIAAGPSTTGFSISQPVGVHWIAIGQAV